MLRLSTIPIACLLAVVLVSGCGEEGATAGATVRIYVSAPLHGAEGDAGRRLCAGARSEASRSGGKVGDLKLAVVCLDAAGKGGRWTLAQVGANARRATEDSTAVAYVGEPDPRARKQSRPIVAAAEIVALGSRNGKEAVERIISSLEEGESEDPRRAVFDAVEG